MFNVSKTTDELYDLIHDVLFFSHLTGNEIVEVLTQVIESVNDGALALAEQDEG
jgi:NTP pyrophosphatase (non-canonical NTP hydrolase)